LELQFSYELLKKQFLQITRNYNNVVGDALTVPNFTAHVTASSGGPELNADGSVSKVMLASSLTRGALPFGGSCCRDPIRPKGMMY
jgi:hypothetical protein